MKKWNPQPAKPAQKPTTAKKRTENTHAGSMKKAGEPAERKRKMKWIRLNDGNLLNLEKIIYIRTGQKSVVYCDETDTPVQEIFGKQSEAEARMRELEKILVQG